VADDEHGEYQTTTTEMPLEARSRPRPVATVREGDDTLAPGGNRVASTASQASTEYQHRTPESGAHSTRQNGTTGRVR
jgi:hypothetical protein